MTIMRNRPSFSSGNNFYHSDKENLIQGTKAYNINSGHSNHRMSAYFIKVYDLLF